MICIIMIEVFPLSKEPLFYYHYTHIFPSEMESGFLIRSLKVSKKDCCLILAVYIFHLIILFVKSIVISVRE